MAQRVAAGRVPRPPKKKVCLFCKDKGQLIDYKDTGLLRRFLSDRARSALATSAVRVANTSATSRWR